LNSWGDEGTVDSSDSTVYCHSSKMSTDTALDCAGADVSSDVTRHGLSGPQKTILPRASITLTRISKMIPYDRQDGLILLVRRVVYERVNLKLQDFKTAGLGRDGDKVKNGLLQNELNH
jgi:hypothetical protein